MKKLIILLIILILISLTGCNMNFLGYNIQITKTYDNQTYDSIKEIAQNLREYKGKEVIIKGKYTSTNYFGKLSEGEYQLYLDDDCTSDNRKYVNGRTYVAKGKILTGTFDLDCNEYLE